MNKERMLQLADYIEKLPEHKFEMQYWISQKVQKENPYGEDYWKMDYAPRMDSNSLSEKLLEPLDCGTACCIAGWATAIQNNFKPIAIMQNGQSIENRALEWLDLTEKQGQNLFLINIDTVWTYYVEKCNFDLIEDEDCFSGFDNPSTVSSFMIFAFNLSTVSKSGSEKSTPSLHFLYSGRSPFAKMKSQEFVETFSFKIARSDTDLSTLLM
jgi:hypothetical protein